MGETHKAEVFENIKAIVFDFDFPLLLNDSMLSKFRVRIYNFIPKC